MKRYFDEPYRFIRPHRSKFWCRSLKPALPRFLRKHFQVHQCKFRGVERLQASQERQAGILLTPNHCGFADPPVLGMLGLQVGQYFYYMASWHLFKQSRWSRFKLTRTGAFSVFREGVDRDAMRESARILQDAERPLVVFPEGTWFRRNDRIGPLQEGVSLIVRKAAKDSKRPIIIHPVAIKYWYLQDPRPAMEAHLATVESRLRWHPQEHLDLHQRIVKLTEAFVSIKEMEYLGTPVAGDLDRRISDLSDHVLSGLEAKYFGKTQRTQPMDRVRALLQVLVKNFQHAKDSRHRKETERDLDKTFFCQVLFGHSQEYLAEWPCVERLAESVKRLEEDLTGAEVLLGPVGAVVEVCEGIDVREMGTSSASGSSELVSEIARRIQSTIHAMLLEGPPPEWNCVTGPKPPSPKPEEAPIPEAAVAAS